MFENLTNKFEEIFSSLKKAPSLDEKQVEEGLRSIRQALLEADVTLEVVKEFINKVKPKMLGQEIIRSTSPGEMVVKIVYDEIVSFLGENMTANQIKLLWDNLKTKEDKIVGLFASNNEKKSLVVCASSENVKSFNCKQAIKDISAQFKGKGGGNKNLAQAGCDTIRELNSSLKIIKNLL